jgi:flagellar basal body-associated protein FliL
MEDGEVLTFQVNLKVKAEDDQEAVQPHVQALEVLMREVGQSKSREELASPEGLRAFAGDLRRNVNNYLRQKQVPTKVQSVAFQELFMSS